tara:strand:+ start:15416 stop:15649 length:234 start_codon:yes stop_codon:yes gene_type:complete
MDLFNKKWLTLYEAAQYLNRCTRQVLRYVENGNLKGHQPVQYGKWTFDRNDLDAWIMFNNSYSKLTRPQKKQLQDLK